MTHYENDKLLVEFQDGAQHREAESTDEGYDAREWTLM